MANNLSVTGLGVPSVATTGTASVTVDYKGDSNAELRLYAVQDGGEPILVGTEQFVVDSGNSGQGNQTVTFDPNGVNGLPPGNYNFYVVADNADPSQPDITSGLLYNVPVICFLQGTLIRTATGEVAVEDLRPGDLVLTADGRREPVVFVGRQSIHPKFGVPEAKNPILIRAGALGENLPARDLRVSPGHALVVDGVLCIAAALVNGVSIVQEATAQEVFAYYNVELAAHEVILAEGAPVESFADNVPRERFDNFAEFQARFPEGREVGEMDLPRAMSRRQVPAATLARLAARAAALFGTTEKAAA